MALIQSRAALESARSDVVAAAAAIESPGRTPAPSRRARLHQDRSAIRRIVTQRNVNTGDLTQPGPTGPPLFVVARSDIMTIRVNVPEAFAAEVDPGDRAW